MEAPAIYFIWYATAEGCTGVKGDYRAIRWFEVPAERWWDPVLREYAIATWRAPCDIYIAMPYRMDEAVVKHEMIHDLLHPGQEDDVRFERCSTIAH